MFARNVSFRLKPNMQADFNRAFEGHVLPLLRKQKGFKEEITLWNANSVDGVSISLWENKSDADHYNTSTYPEVMKTFEKVIDGAPRVQTFDSVNMTTTQHASITT